MIIIDEISFSFNFNFSFSFNSILNGYYDNKILSLDDRFKIVDYNTRMVIYYNASL